MFSIPGARQSVRYSRPETGRFRYIPNYFIAYAQKYLYFNTSNDPQLIRSDKLDLNWLDSIRQPDTARIRSASNTTLFTSETIAVHLPKNESFTPVLFVVVKNLAVHVLLKAAIIDRFICLVSPA